MREVLFILTSVPVVRGGSSAAVEVGADSVDSVAGADVEAEDDSRSCPLRSRVNAFSGAWRLSRLDFRLWKEDIAHVG